MNNKIINKSTATFKKWMATFLNNKFTAEFIDFYTKPYEIMRIDQVKSAIWDYKGEISDVMTNTNLSNPENKDLIDAVNEERNTIKVCKKLINEAHLDDLIVHKFNSIDGSDDYHIMNGYDLIMLSSKLSDFLHYNIPITYKIKWALKNKNISDSKFAKKVNMYQQQISYFKHGKRNIGNMTLTNALNIAKYYDTMAKEKLDKLF